MEANGHNFWEFKKYREHEWFRFQVILLLLLVASYIFSHIIIDNYTKTDSNYEITVLTSDQNKYLDQLITPHASTNAVDSADLNTVAHKKVVERIISYLSNEFNDKWSPVQKDSIYRYLLKVPILDAKLFLEKTRFKIESNFWLIGPAVYWEIIFWSLFGVVSSILFNLSIISKNATTNPSNPRTVFDSSEIPSQIAKLLYAPLCTIIVVLGYNFFTDQMVDIKSSKGIIVFAFVAGFYSSRLISLLDRIKEVILPANSMNVNNDAGAGANNLIEAISIELKISDSVEQELQNEITEIGLNDALVTIENEQTGEKLVAKVEGADQSNLFKVTQVRAGKYKISAVWSAKIFEQSITLSTVQHIELKNAEDKIILTLDKSETVG